MTDAPPEAIRLDGATVRREAVADAPRIARVIDENLPRLSFWMDWATPEVANTAAQVARIDSAHAKWTAREAFDYLIVDIEDEVLGKIGFPRRIGADALELGYWLTQGAEGRGLITQAARALTRAGLQVDGIERIEIHCDEANTKSSAVPHRLGYRLDRIVDFPVTTEGQTGRQMIWVDPAEHTPPS
ncbi:GNAT family N-acetyltransferase [Rhodococcus sp. NPDC058521]|uniref:GNAT family N-acetyltransferase n=1 Tax=Rhodococcus sp. NPDC058521 TaxID=3346536 RepID=UPI0036543822